MFGKTLHLNNWFEFWVIDVMIINSNNKGLIRLANKLGYISYI